MGSTMRYPEDFLASRPRCYALAKHGQVCHAKVAKHGDRCQHHQGRPHAHEPLRRAQLVIAPKARPTLEGAVEAIKQAPNDPKAPQAVSRQRCGASTTSGHPCHLRRRPGFDGCKRHGRKLEEAGVEPEDSPVKVRRDAAKENAKLWDAVLLQTKEIRQLRMRVVALEQALIEAQGGACP